jgi:hypothetical protein
VAVAIAIGALVVVSPPCIAAPVASVEVRHDAVALGADLASDLREVLGLPEGSPSSYLDVSLKPQVLALKLLLIALWTLLALAASFAVPRALVRASGGLSGRLGKMLVLGILFHVSMLLTAILFTALIRLIVGLPLLVLFLVVVTLFESLALGAAFHLLGERILSRRQADGTSGYAKILLGALVMGAIALVPLAGEIAWCAASCAGTGAVLATWRSGRAASITPR